MNIWAFNRASDKKIIDFVTTSLKNGISRFGWGYKNKLDIRELAPKPWDEMSKEEIEIYNKQNFLLDIKKGDWIVHINIPKVGQVTAGQVIEEYNFDNEDNEINDFRHFFKLDKDSIVEFDRNADFVPDEISKKLKLRGRYWRIYDKDDFSNIIDAINEHDIKKELEKAKKTKNLTLENKIINDDAWQKITKLTDIEELSFINTDIGKVPQNIGNLTSVKSLHIEICYIEEFDSNFKKLSNLKELTYIDDDDDVEISVNDIYFEHLEDLIMPSIKINKYSELEYLLNLVCTHIPDIDLSSLDISKLPEDFFILDEIVSLNLSNNKFKNIPKEILYLGSLKILDLTNNQITEIPEEILELEKIVKIYFYNNPNVLKFTYNFPLKLNKNLKRLFPDLQQIGKQTIGEKFIHLRTENNTILFEIKEESEESRLFDVLFLKRAYEEIDYRSCFNISIFGDKKTQKQVLNKIKNEFDKIISQNNIKFNSDIDSGLVTRFFYYPISKSEMFINYEKLLNHIKANDKFYNQNDFNIPIYDLINFIGEENIQIDKEWNGEDYVTNINIKNFKIFKDIDFELSKNINIILGNNGLGKTSFLQALTLGLLNRDSIEEYTKKFPTYINFNSERSEIKINWGKNEYRKLWIEKNAIPKEESPITPPYNIMLAYGVNLNTTKYQEHTKFVTELIKGSEESYFTESIFEDNYAEMHDPLKILEHLDNEIKLPYHLRDELKLKIKIKNIDSEYKEIILINNLILETINSFLQLITESEQIQIHYINHVYYFKDFFGNNLKTEHLSEGYKDHILLITDIIVRILSVRSSILGENEKLEINETIFHKAKGIIIIDEFDRHLHPNWQRKLLFELRKYFPKIQFILTTHNIFSLQSAVGAMALIVKKENNKITVTNKKIPKGFSIESIYKLFFDGKGKMYDTETEESLKIFKKLLRKKRIGKITKEEEIKFKKEANKMLDSESCEIKDIVTMEIRQFEQKTKKTIEL